MSESALERFARLERTPLAPVTSTGPDNRGFKASVRAILAHRQLLGLLVRRDIKARYKDSALGLLWTLINPIVQLMVYYVVMGQILGAARGIPGFAIYIFAGLTIYGLFSECLVGGSASILANAGLVKKVFVPREVFPLAAVGSSLFTFAVQLLVLVVASVALGMPPTVMNLVYAVPALAIIVIYGLALALLLAALNVYLRDVQYLTQIFLMLAMWSSPIVYSWTMVAGLFSTHHLPNWLLEAYSNTPLTLAVLGFHRAFWSAATPNDFPVHLVWRMAAAMLIGLGLLWLCQRLFARMQGNFAQEL